MNEITEWLLNGPPWVEYRTRIDILDQPEDAPEVAGARRAMLANPAVQGLIKELTGWPGHCLKRHNDATLMLHKLVFLADIGVKASDSGMDAVIESISSHRSDEGVFRILANFPKHFGGSGEDEWAWVLCDTPSILYAMLKMDTGVPLLEQAVAHLESLSRENGWPCAASPEIGKFKGPGKKEDPCPYATLISLKVLAQAPGKKDSDACRSGIETLLKLWEQRKEKRPYLFAMGTDFKKLKTPFIWYDILHVLDTLSRFPQAYGDERFREMLEILGGKASPEQHFTAESVWKAWSEWDFGQKKTPSAWITFLAHRILKRTGLSLESIQ